MLPCAAHTLESRWKKNKKNKPKGCVKPVSHTKETKKNAFAFYLCCSAGHINVGVSLVQDVGVA